MIQLEQGPQRLTLQSGSTTVVLDKAAGKAILHRKLLFWARSPVERALSSIAEARIMTSTDPASGAELCSVMLMLREGGGWALSARDRQDATAAVAAAHDLLGLVS
jgi:hypothetical protein